MKNLLKLLVRVAGIVSGQNQKEQKDVFNNQVTSLGMTKNSEIIYPYGMKAKPPTHTRCLSFLGNGNEDATISMPVMPGNGKIPEVNDNGEVIWGNEVTGDYIVANKNGISMFGNITINGTVTITGKTTVQDDLDVTKDVTALDCKTTSGISLKDHIHAMPANPIPGTGSYQDTTGNLLPLGDSGKPVVIP